MSLMVKPTTVKKCAIVLGLRNMGKSFQEIRVVMGFSGKEEARRMYAKALYIQRWHIQQRRSNGSHQMS